ncbi:ATP-binding protein [Nocardioides sp. DS6]|uniref:Sensor-like histidine kinase SenX3 n=1 Tax=Nocardioides eburneus TaxID=3231482 RepID=A0ABV3SYX9_9ACTN
MPWRDAWRPSPDTGDRRTFQLIALGLTQLVGFGAAIVSVVRGDELEVVAVAAERADSAGDPEGGLGGDDEQIGVRWPVAVLDEALATGERWGRFCFVPHRADPQAGASHGAPASGTASDPASGTASDPATDTAGGGHLWHPGDLLVSPVYDGDGVLRGAVMLDDPVGGRRPSGARLRLMDKYAAQAERVIVTALERERLAAQTRLLDAARLVVRQASRERSLDAVLRETGETLREAFGAAALWTRVFATGDEAPEVVQYFADGDLRRDLRLAEIGERTARRLWELDDAAVISLATTSNPALPQVDVDYVRGFLERGEYSAVLCAPLGAGPECLGSLAILRPVDAARFRGLEIAAARDIGRDLGRLLLTARTFQEEQRLVARLRELDAYKSQLVARMADELSTPLKAIVHCVDELRTSNATDPALVRELRERSDRMARLVDDLLLLARVTDRPLDGTALDLAAAVADVANRLEGDGRILPGRLDLALAPATITGDDAALERLVTTMLETAIAFSDGAPARVAVRPRTGEVELVVTAGGGDTDQLRGLLLRYFGVTDPRVLDRPGTGIGLTLVDAIVRQHGGRITVTTGPDAGLCVTFPAR